MTGAVGQLVVKGEPAMLLVAIGIKERDIYAPPKAIVHADDAGKRAVRAAGDFDDAFGNPRRSVLGGSLDAVSPGIRDYEMNNPREGLYVWEGLVFIRQGKLLEARGTWRRATALDAAHLLCEPPACTCTGQETAHEGNPTGHATTCPRWGTRLPNPHL